MAWSYDEYGFPVYFEDPAINADPLPGYNANDYTMYDPLAEYGGVWDPATMQDPLAGFDWSTINLDDPAVWDQYGLTQEDFLAPTVDDENYSGTPLDSQTALSLQRALERGDYQTAESILPGSSEGYAAMQSSDPAQQAAGKAWWERALSTLGGLGAAAGGSILKAAGDNPLAALTLLAGGGAAIGALASKDPDPMKAPDFTAPVQLSPEQRSLLGYTQAQAAREEELGQLQFPIQQGVLGSVWDQLPGLRRQTEAEQGARDWALQNIHAGLAAPPDPNAMNPAYAPYWQTGLTAEEQIQQELATPGQASLFAQRQAEEQRRRFEKQQLEALGTGYTTSFPYNQAKSDLEQKLSEYLQTDMETRRANRLAMLSGVSMPRAQQAEQTTAGRFGREVTGQQTQLQQYQGLNQTQDTLAKLAATAQMAAPSGAAERGLGALTGIRDKQQELLNSIYQFNANLQNQKNQNLWNFAGTALGGGLYGLKKSTA